MKVFLDASVIITGINSKNSASNIILKLSQKGKIKTFVSSITLNEVIRNLNKNFPKEVLQDFLTYLSKSNFKKIEFKDESEVLKFQGVTTQKDIHVIAAASKAKVDFIITFDRKHLLSIKEGTLPFIILSPADLIKKIFSKNQSK